MGSRLCVSHYLGSPGTQISNEALIVPSTLSPISFSSIPAWQGEPPTITTHSLD